MVLNRRLAQIELPCLEWFHRKIKTDCTTIGGDDNDARDDDNDNDIRDRGTRMMMMTLRM